jgi:dipeptidyl aminopeptidase/acylaminoacyl peptidase
VLAFAQAPFSLEQVLGAAFPSDLTAAPAGGKIAWVSNARGVRNVMVAEPPEYRGRAITSYTADDGQEIGPLAWTPDASAVVYVRGGEPNRAGEAPNPAHNPKGEQQAVWIVSLAGGAPKKLGDGGEPAVSPKGDRVAFARRGQIWWAPLDGKVAAAQAFVARGECGRPWWSPDGSRIAFVSGRGDHSFIGVYDAAANTLGYVDPGTDFDQYPSWSPDGKSIAFIRAPSNGMRSIRKPEREGEPWSIRVADVATGGGREIWRARAGQGSVFRGVAGERQLFWAAGGRIVFPWEGDGWTHLYSIGATGGAASLLTPGAFEVEDVTPAHGGRDVVYSSNQGDIDRRHLWTVAASGGTPSQSIPGDAIECKPVAADSAIAFLQADWRTPLRVAVLVQGRTIYPDGTAIPSGFPSARMVKPEPVVFKAGDGTEIHGQLFLPPNRNGRVPAVVFFHGGSRRQMLLGWHYMYYYANCYALNQFLANSGYAVLSANYRSGIGYGLAFREALGYGPAGGSEYNDVKAAGEYLRTRAEVDGARIGAWGGSYGGYLTAMALARSSDLYRAGVDLHGVHDWAKELGIPAGEPDYKVAFDSSPMAFLNTWKSPVLLIQGDDDRNVQFNQTVMLADALRRRNVEIEELIFPDEVHDFLLWRSWVRAYSAAVEFFRIRLR